MPHLNDLIKIVNGNQNYLSRGFANGFFTGTVTKNRDKGKANEN